MPADLTCMGFDFGLKHVGVAFGQAYPVLTRPMDVLKARNGVPDWERLARWIQDWQPQVLVVGLPLQADGEVQPLTGHAKGFARALRKRCSLPVCWVDERYSTCEARAALFESGGYGALQKREIDLHCAEQICEMWLLQQSRQRFT